MLTVKQVAEKLNLTEYAIRYYTDQGLVPTVQRNQHNERIFDDESIEWLYGCKMLRRTGISIKQIKRYVELCKQGKTTLHDRYSLMLNEQQRAVKRLEEAKQNLAFLNQKVAIYEREIQEGGNVDPLNPNK
ncbi:MerR family transcriptional regulator [Lactobacillaceae bacterium Melli_B4]